MDPAEFIVWPGAGHGLITEKFEDFNQGVLRNLKRAAPQLNVEHPIELNVERSVESPIELNVERPVELNVESPVEHESPTENSEKRELQTPNEEEHVSEPESVPV